MTHEAEFATWMEDRRLRMSTVSSAALLDFLNLNGEDGTRDLQSKIAYRYLRLLERCYMHLQVFPNPARNAVFDGFREKQADEPMIALTPEQRAQFVAALPEGRTWKRRRDRAMQMTMLYGGPRVSEIIGLLISEVATQPELDGSIKIVLTPEEKNPSSYEHTTWLQKEGVEELLSWLAERKRLIIPGLLAFPANDEGAPLNKATVYRQVKATFARANIDVKRAGGRTLRNTFSVQQLEAGATTRTWSNVWASRSKGRPRRIRRRNGGSMKKSEIDAVLQAAELPILTREQLMTLAGTEPGKRFAAELERFESGDMSARKYLEIATRVLAPSCKAGLSSAAVSFDLVRLIKRAETDGEGMFAALQAVNTGGGNREGAVNYLRSLGIGDIIPLATRPAPAPYYSFKIFGKAAALCISEARTRSGNFTLFKSRRLLRLDPRRERLLTGQTRSLCSSHRKRLTKH